MTPTTLSGAAVIKPSDLPQEVVSVLGDRLSRHINTMVQDMIEQTKAGGGVDLYMSPGVEKAVWALRDFLYGHVYDNMEVHADFIKASKVIRELWEKLATDDKAYKTYVGPLPDQKERFRPDNRLHRRDDRSVLFAAL